MSYHDLSDSGMTAEARREEASRILLMILHTVDQMQRHEADFVTRVDDIHAPISTKQLFWLRDIRDKYL